LSQSRIILLEKFSDRLQVAPSNIVPHERPIEINGAHS